MTQPVAEAAAADRPLIEVEGLSRWYGSLQAVDHLTFSIRRGEVVGFLGPNGAGKSSTLRMLVGFLGPSSGRVRVAGHDVVQQPLLARQSLGYMPEAASLYPEMRVGEYLRFRARLKRLPRAQRVSQVAASLAKVEIESVAQRRISGLSRGYRQRVALADALLGNPPILILDEPTAGLDPNQIHSVRKLIGQLGQNHTVLLSTHILSEVESICSRVLVLHRGRLVAEGSIAELKRRAGGPHWLLALQGSEAHALTVLQGDERVQSAQTLSALAARGEALLGDSDGATQGSGLTRIQVQLSSQLPEPMLAISQLVAALVGAGVGVVEVRRVERSLEEVFRGLTRPTGASPSRAEPPAASAEAPQALGVEGAETVGTEGRQ